MTHWPTALRHGLLDHSLMAERITGIMEAMPANATNEIDYSIVVPVYFNEGELDEAMKSLKHDVIDRNPTLRGEVIFVDDGSGDNSFAKLLRIRSTDPRTITREFADGNMKGKSLDRQSRRSGGEICQ